MVYERIKYINGKPYIYSQESFRDKDGKVHTKHIGYFGRALQAEDVERMQAKNDISKAINEEKYASIKYKKLAKKHPEDKKKILEISKEEKQHGKELKSIKKEEILSIGEETEKNELKLFIENDSQLYHSRTEPIIKNLTIKKAQGKYVHEKAPKAFSYLVDDGAKKYSGVHAKGQEWHKIFPKNVRDSLAKDMVKDFEQEHALGNYDEHIPKKYRKEKILKEKPFPIKNLIASDNEEKHDKKPSMIKKSEKSFNERFPYEVEYKEYVAGSKHKMFTTKIELTEINKSDAEKWKDSIEKENDIIPNSVKINKINENSKLRRNKNNFSIFLKHKNFKTWIEAKNSAKKNYPDNTNIYYGYNKKDKHYYKVK